VLDMSTFAVLIFSWIWIRYYVWTDN